MSDSLASWNEGKAKETILNYVGSVTDPNQATFVPIEDRIATFDNDGCCWNEKPAYIQLFFSLARLKQMATDDPALRGKPHFRAAYEGDMGYFAQLDPHAGGDVKELMQVVFDSHAGMTQDVFEAMVREFMTTARHPRFDVPFKQLTYQPMVELLRYLEAHGFRNYIVSGGGRDFVRGIAADLYGIPRQRVIGSTVTYRFIESEHGGEIVQMPELDVVDDGPAKPVQIWNLVGRRPVLAAGNSNGDIQMLMYTEGSKKPFLNLLLNHDDPIREFEYNQGAEKALHLAAQRGWAVISMYEDWKEVFYKSS
jgi:phosphoglycolate phosphatase-like HAD superfamily hydrolase